MKLSFLLLATALIASAAHAGEYENWIAASAEVECKSTVGTSTKKIVKTTKTNLDPANEEEGITSVEVLAQVQVGSTVAKRKYVIDTVMVDLLTEADIQRGIAAKPIIVKGKHAVTGEELKIEIEQGFADETGFFPATLFVKGKKQTYKKLSCNIAFVG